MRKALTLAVLVAVLAVGAAACDNEADVTPSTPVTEDAGMDDLFLDTIHAQLGGEVAGVTDSTLIGLGHSVCYGFDNGRTFATMTTIGINEGFSPYSIGGIIGVSIGAYCPEHIGQIPA